MSDRTMEKARAALELYLRHERMERRPITMELGAGVCTVWVDGTNRAEHRRQVAAAYRAANLEARLEYNRQYHRENAQRLSEAKRLRRHTDPEYAERHREKSRRAKQRARERAAAAAVAGQVHQVHQVEAAPAPGGELAGALLLQVVWGIGVSGA
jgi:hypothetical protein